MNFRFEKKNRILRGFTFYIIENYEDFISKTVYIVPYSSMSRSLFEIGFSKWYK